MVIKVVPYSSLWVKVFQEEANIIKDRLKEKCLDIYHIGSTSVYGLIAKPSVDILCIVDKLNDSLIVNAKISPS